MSPWILRVFSFYSGASFEEALTGRLDNRNIILANRTADMINEYEVSYVVCRDQNIYLKFSEDPKFQLVFNSGNVTVFQAVK